MGEVVNLPKPNCAEYCFQCGCDSQDFRLMFGGTIECKGCGLIVTTAVWVHLPPEIREGAKK